MSIYGKLAAARADFHSRKIEKTGHNKFAGYSYFELADFLIPGMDCLGKQGLVPVVSFNASEATLTVFDVKSEQTIVITSPMSSAALKGCHDVQNLGAVQTYLRRYLWTALLEIVEHDAVDGAPPQKEQALPAYPAKDFKSNWETWESLIAEGKATPAALIAKISTRFTLSDKQKDLLQSLEVSDEAA